jgi:hypothetical protein
MPSLAPNCERDTGRYCFAIEQDSASAALAAIATGFGSGKLRYVSQIVDK